MSKDALARISHQISEQIAPLLPQIASQNGEGSVHETRTHRAGEQDGVTRCASCQRAGEKCGLGLDDRFEAHVFKHVRETII